MVSVGQFYIFKWALADTLYLWQRT